MNYLENIVKKKRQELRTLKESIPVSFLEKATLFSAERPSFYQHLSKPGPSIIAEFKRKSPSKGVLNDRADIIKTVQSYENAGASAISVLTDKHFDGRAVDLSVSYEAVNIPILRKDFIIDEFQVYEAKSVGASAILLIAAILEKNEVEELSVLAEKLGMDVLLEIHEKDEIHKISDKNRIIGINNRNLKTFEVDLERSIEIANQLPEGLVKVAESGISSVETIEDLYRHGFDAFLLGEIFMKSHDPGATAIDFFRKLAEKNLNNDNLKYSN